MRFHATSTAYQYPGAIDHVMSRGNWRDDIVLNDVDRQNLLKTLAEAFIHSGLTGTTPGLARLPGTVEPAQSSIHSESEIPFLSGSGHKYGNLPAITDASGVRGPFGGCTQRRSAFDNIGPEGNSCEVKRQRIAGYGRR